MKKRLLALALACAMLLSCALAEGTAAAKGLSGLLAILEEKKPAGPLPDPALVLDGEGELLAQDYSFSSNYLCDAYIFPNPTDFDAFFAQYMTLAKAARFTQETAKVEGKQTDCVVDGAGHIALFIPDFDGYMLVLVQQGMQVEWEMEEADEAAPVETVAPPVEVLVLDVEPTATPTVEPTATPTVEPTATPTVEPTATPTVEPTATPTVEPTATPTVEPTATPTVEPTATPTAEPAVEEATAAEEFVVPVFVAPSIGLTNVRSAPYKAEETLYFQVDSGDVLIVLEGETDADGEIWWQVVDYCTGLQGYVLGSVVDAIDDETAFAMMDAIDVQMKAATPTPVPAVTPTPTVTPTPVCSTMAPEATRTPEHTPTPALEATKGPHRLRNLL